MGFWIFMLICVLITPLMMLTLGYAYVKGHYPKEINDAFGYRTKLTMRNKEVWEYSQKLFGKVFLIAGAVTLPLSIIPMLFVINSDVSTCGWTGGAAVGVQVIVILLLLPFMEKAVKKKYPL